VRTFFLFILAIILIALSGCAKDQYPNAILIQQLDMSGKYVPFATSQLGGVGVYKRGNISGVVVTYKDGDKINVTVGEK